MKNKDMLILGLGSNIEDRLAYLRKSLALIKKIPDLIVEQVSPIYVSDPLLPHEAPADWNLPYLNLALRCKTSQTPLDLLAHIKQIEKIIGRNHITHWGPRPIDIDILAWDDHVQYDKKLHIPHEHLTERPFALWPLCDVAPRWVHPILKKTAIELVMPWGSKFDGSAPLRTRQIQQRIDTPQLVGILNITPDSFSDGGNNHTLQPAVNHFQQLIAEGAEVIDIGAEATGPNAIPLSFDEEWRRLQPILENIIHLKNFVIKPKISIDTYHPETALRALKLGVDWINDVKGLTEPGMQLMANSYSCDLVMMHHLTVPVKKNDCFPLEKNPVELTYSWAEHQIELLSNQGISPERLIFDIGIGYGKTASQSLELIQAIEEFKKLGVRLLVGHSRKSFLQQFTENSPRDRDIETTILSLHLLKKSVDYLRVHNVSMHSRAFKINAAANSMK